jgi:uncharacterized protein (TIRG00374 family)
MRRAGSFLLVLALLGAGVVPLMLGGSAAVSSSLALAPSDYAALIALVLVSWLLRAAKQDLLMRRLQLRANFLRVLAISQATEFAFLATPAGVGGYAAGIFYLRRIGASYASATAISAADQILDLVFFALAMPVALLFLVDAPEIGALRGIARAAAVLTAVAIVAAWCLRRPLTRWLFGDEGAPFWLERLPYLKKRSVELRSFLHNLRAQLGALSAGSPRFLLALISCTALQWATRYGVLWLIMTLLGCPVPYALLFLLQGFVLHAAQWTGAPAGAGGADVGLAASLAAFAPAETIAAALLLWRFATLHLSLLGGLLAIVTLQPRTAVAAQEAEEAAA